MKHSNEATKHMAEHREMRAQIKELFLRLDTLLNIVISKHPDILEEFQEYLKEADDKEN